MAISKFGGNFGWMRTIIMPVMAIIGMQLAGANETPEIPAPKSPVASSARMEQKIGVALPAETSFLDENGKAVQLKSYLGSRPVILVFSYFKCPHLCTLVLNGLVDSLEELKLKLGKDFSIVTISIDPREKPELALMKQRTYLARLGLTPSSSVPWHFLTGEDVNIRAMADAAGFHYAWDPVSRDYAHPAGLIILTPDGTISRYLAGIHFEARELRLALVEASERKIGSTLDRLFLTCFHYDATTGKYSPRVLVFIRIFGAASAIGLLTGLAILSRRKKGHPA